jgi:hypothetical protein
MTTTMIFVLGVFVTLVTLSAVVLIGVSEAADPAHSRAEDLTAWERSLVAEDRSRRIAEEGTEGDSG